MKITILDFYSILLFFDRPPKKRRYSIWLYFFNASYLRARSFTNRYEKYFAWFLPVRPVPSHNNLLRFDEDFKRYTPKSFFCSFIRLNYIAQDSKLADSSTVTNTNAIATGICKAVVTNPVRRCGTLPSNNFLTRSIITSIQLDKIVS